MSKKNAVPQTESEVMTIASAVAETGLSQLYIRKAIRSGALPSVLVPVKADGKTMRREFTRADFVAWREAAASHSKRDDGRNKFVLYMTPDEALRLQDLVAGEPFANLIARANQKTEATDAE